MKQAKVSGIFYAAFASLWWGVLGTLYFKFVSFATPIELTIHRTIWTAILLIITTGIFSKWGEFKKIIKNKKNIILLNSSHFEKNPVVIINKIVVQIVL